MADDGKKYKKEVSMWLKIKEDDEEKKETKKYRMEISEDKRGEKINMPQNEYE